MTTLYFLVPDLCNSDPCDSNAECSRESVLTDGFTCTCNAPFEGDGMTCESTWLLIENNLANSWPHFIF